ncbi:ATP-binding protein [Psychromonas sp.]|uniref:ATP-binding protein n=1 Tax=Psychromonas sp. TaxID=1884585 RepID=UPI0039E41FBD
MKIHNKLFLILFSFSLLLVTALVLLIQWSIGKGMIEYVNSKEIETLKPLVVELASEYQKVNSWSTIEGQHKKFADLLFLKLKDSAFIQPPPPADEFRKPPPVEFGDPPEFRPPPAESRGPHRPPRDRAGYALLDNKQNLIAGRYRENFKYTNIAITVDNINVGWLVIPKRNQITDGYALDFIEQQRSYLWIIALTAMILVVLITLPLAHHLVGPIKLIMVGMHKLTQGNYQQHINLQRQDELGDLSRDFNELAITLHENESARKRWLANISHELRTPVAILRGELEAMLDDVRPLSKKNIDSANDEVKHLQYLIDDLHQLTSADIGGMHYNKKTDNLTLWVSSEVKKYSSYLADAGIKLVVEIEDAQAEVFADTIRLSQLFDNLINNCIKYADASLVKISLAVDGTPIKPLVRVKVEDNGVGVAEQNLPNLFEYLYRVENSRNRKTGGSGLGLSICAHIVAAHQGEISAEQSSLGGLAIVIELPLSK